MLRGNVRQVRQLIGKVTKKTREMQKKNTFICLCQKILLILRLNGNTELISKQ